MLTATDIFKNYGILPVLKGVDIHITKGEIVSIVGSSGAGKSTLLHILGTLDKADRGSVSLDGKRIEELNGRKLSAFRNKNIGFVFQFHHLLPEFTALENVCIPGWIAGSKKKEIIEKTGMFPEKFFLYYEEWDWSVRIQKAGYSIWYQAAATIFHKDSMSVGKKNPLKVYYHTRNRIMFMRRNSPAFPLLVFTLFFTFLSLPKAIAGYLLKGQFPQARWFLKGVGYNLVHSVEN